MTLRTSINTRIRTAKGAPPQRRRLQQRPKTRRTCLQTFNNSCLPSPLSLSPSILPPPTSASSSCFFRLPSAAATATASASAQPQPQPPPLLLQLQLLRRFRTRSLFARSGSRSPLLIPVVHALLLHACLFCLLFSSPTRAFSRPLSFLFFFRPHFCSSI